MKATRKLTKRNNQKVTTQKAKKSQTMKQETSSGESTPEIMARSRRSLTGISEGNEDEKDQQVEMMELHVIMQQQREFEELKEALKESQEHRQTTSLAYKPRVPRPQDTAYQAVIQLKEKSGQEQESESTNEGKEMLKLFTNLTTALKDT